MLFLAKINVIKINMRNDPSENTVKSIINWDNVFNSVKIRQRNKKSILPLAAWI